MIWLLLFFDFAFARHSLSAARPATVTYRTFLQQAQHDDFFGPPTVVESARNIGDNIGPLLEETPVSLMELQTLFSDLRDHRPATDEKQIARRIPWLYPDDGCYARSALSQVRLSSRGYQAFKQIFVFGNLSLKTTNHPRGLVTWWYHVAPILKTPQGVFVLDPAVESRKPMVLEEWLDRFLPNTFDAKISICSAGAYSPDSACFPEEEIEYHRAMKAVTEEYLPLEWSRLHHLGRDPHHELGPHSRSSPDRKTVRSSFFHSMIQPTIDIPTLKKELL